MLSVTEAASSVCEEGALPPSPGSPPPWFSRDSRHRSCTVTCEDYDGFFVVYEEGCHVCPVYLLCLSFSS